MKENKNKIGIGKYLKTYMPQIVLYAIVNIIASLVTIVITLMFANAIEKVTTKAYLEAIYVFLIIIGLVSVRRVAWWSSGFLYNKYSTKIMTELSSDLAKQAFKLNSETYSNNETGRFVQRIVNDPERLINNLADLISTVTELITAIVIIIYISTLSIFIGLTLIGLISICLLMEVFRIKLYRKNHRKTRKAHDKINSITTEIVRSEKDIKAIGLEDKLSEVSKKYYEDCTTTSYKESMVDMNCWSFRNHFIEVVSIGMLILGVVLLNKALLAFSAFMIVYSNNNELYWLVWQLGNLSSKLTEIKISSDRMFSLFAGKEFVCEKFGDVNLENVKGEIEFRNVSYAYNEYEKLNDDEENKDTKPKKKKKKDHTPKIISTNQVFNDLSFKIVPNSTVAFVGKSGSGKSTILNLMSKMYEVNSGEVLIDGVNINDLTKQSLRGAISLVNQFPYIFDMSIKENLLLAKKDATDEEINQAIADAAFDDFVATLKNGINTNVGESGIKLSGGQKQRLAIARALLRNSAILIFDESTSSLDNFAQESIKRSIDNLKGKSTIVIVAHRLSTIKNADKIYFLDEGKIVDSGTFDELFGRNEKFKNMFLAENI